MASIGELFEQIQTLKQEYTQCTEQIHRELIKRRQMEETIQVTKKGIRDSHEGIAQLQL